MTPAEAIEHLRRSVSDCDRLFKLLGPEQLEVFKEDLQWVERDIEALWHHIDLHESRVVSVIDSKDR